MENPEEIQQNGPVGPEIGRSDGFSAENAAEKYVEELREKFREMKERENDPHLNLINPDDLTGGDLVILDKWINGTLTKEDFEDYSKELRERFESVRRADGAKEEIEKLKKEHSLGAIGDEEFDERFRKILADHDAESGLPGKRTEPLEADSRANFEAMIRNKLVASKKV